MIDNKRLKLRWRHDSGDGEDTYDWYLWINGEPTTHLISQCSGIYFCYINDKERYMAESLREGKEFILDELHLA